MQSFCSVLFCAVIFWWRNRAQRSQLTCCAADYHQQLMDAGLLDSLLRVGKTSNPEIKYRLAASFNSLASNGS